MDEVNMLKMEYDYRIHAMEDTIETKAFEVEELQINLEELQEGMKDKRREIETLICQINNWKTACKQSDYGYGILRKKHEESEKENKLLKRKIKGEPTYENDLNNKRISTEDNTEQLMGSGMSLIQVDSGCFLENKYLIHFLKRNALDWRRFSSSFCNIGFQHFQHFWLPTLAYNTGLQHLFQHWFQHLFQHWFQHLFQH